MRKRVLMAAAAMAIAIPAQSAVLVTIKAQASGTQTTYCITPTPACAVPPVVTPISNAFTYSFLATPSPGGTFSFSGAGPYESRPASISGTFVRQADGGYTGANFQFVQDQLPSGRMYVSVWQLSAPLFAVAFDGNLPEPSTWAMMIAGFGSIGGAMRRRRVSVSVSVSFA